MILFEEDKSIQGCIYDYKTTNLSAIKLAVQLGRMGIKNNKFVLSLYQPELSGIDAHDPNLSEIIKAKIAVECKLNIWYFLRECVRVPSQGKDAIPYIFNRANVALTWLFCNSVTPFLTMPRQVGKTISTISLMSWVMFIGGKRLSVALFAKDHDLVLENVERLKIIRDGLPYYLVSTSMKDTENKEGIGYHKLQTKYTTTIAQASKTRASGQGRGPSLCLEHWDEFAYYTNNHISYSSATSAIVAAAEQVRETGMPCTNLITTTAGKLSEDAGKYAFKIKNNCMRFTEKLYDSKDVKTLKKIVNANSRNKMCYLEYSYKQLGKTDEWFEEVIVDKDPDTIACDYLNIWQHISSNSVIPKQLSDLLDRNQREPVLCTVHDNLVVRWFVHPDEIDKGKRANIPYIIGSDTSANVGRDFTTFVMIDPTTMQVVCTCKCNVSNFVHIAACIMHFLTKYRNSILIAENNYVGKNLLDVIVLQLISRGFNPLKKLYNLWYQEHDGVKELPYMIDGVTGDIIKNFGFHTGAKSREHLYKTVLIQAIKTNYNKINDPDIISEIKGLIMKNNRVDHSVGGHDDLLIAYMLACFFVLYGKNIRLYGVDRSIFLSEVSHTGNKIDPHMKQQQMQIYKKIQQIKQTLKNCSSSTLKYKYVSELKSLELLLDKEILDIDTLSMDQVITQKEEKKKEFNIFDGSNKSLELFSHFSV